MTKSAMNGVAGHPALSPATSQLECIESGITCCGQAREAARLGRLAAAQGLLQTAISMYHRAELAQPSDLGDVLADRVLLDGDSGARFENLVSELCYSAQVIEVEGVARQSGAPHSTVGDA